MQAGDPILSVDVTRIHTDRFVDGFGVFRVCRLIAQRKLLRIPALLIAAAFCWASAAFEPHCRDVATRHRPTYENRPTSRAPGAVSAYSEGVQSLRQPNADTWVSHTNWWKVTAAAQLGFLVRDGVGSRLHGQHGGVAVGWVELDRDPVRTYAKASSPR